MRRLFYIFLWFFWLFYSLSPASRAIEIDLSENKIDIRYGFQGVDLILFGTVGVDAATSGNFDIIIVVRGPDVAMTVRQKEKFADLIWVNKRAVVFENVPGYYAVATSNPLAEIAPAEIYQAQSIGLDHLVLKRTNEADWATSNDAHDFAAAVLRLRTAEGLYREERDSVSILREGLFRTNIHLPVNVPVGRYLVEAYAFQEKELQSVDQISLMVEKAGFERAIYHFAHDAPFLYGISAVIMALLAGWAASLIGRRR